MPYSLGSSASVHSATKSASTCDLMAQRGFYVMSNGRSSMAHLAIRPVASRLLIISLRGCNSPKIGLSIFVLLFLPSIFKIFLLSLLDDYEKFCHFQPFKTLLMSFSVGKTSFASAQFLLNPNSNFLEFGYALVITKEPPFSLFCWSSQLIPEIILSFLTLDMQKYC